MEMQACPRLPHTGGTGAPSQLFHREWRSLGCPGLLGLPQIWGIFLLLRCWWVQADTGSMKEHDQSPFSMSTTTPEVHWHTVRGNAESFLFLPPNDLHNAQATDTLSSLLNHAQLKHNHLQLWFTWILVVWKYLWHGWDSFHFHKGNQTYFQALLFRRNRLHSCQQLSPELV